MGISSRRSRDRRPKSRSLTPREPVSKILRGMRFERGTVLALLLSASCAVSLPGKPASADEVQPSAPPAPVSSAPAAPDPTSPAPPSPSPARRPKIGLALGGGGARGGAHVGVLK